MDLHYLFDAWTIKDSFHLRYLILELLIVLFFGSGPAWFLQSSCALTVVDGFCRPCCKVERQCPRLWHSCTSEWVTTISVNFRIIFKIEQPTCSRLHTKWNWSTGILPTFQHPIFQQKKKLIIMSTMDFLTILHL